MMRLERVTLNRLTGVGVRSDLKVENRVMVQQIPASHTRIESFLHALKGRRPMLFF